MTNRLPSSLVCAGALTPSGAGRGVRWLMLVLAERDPRPGRPRQCSTREKLSPAQLHFMGQVELSLPVAENASAAAGPSILMGLSIGALVLAIYGYPLYPLAREQFLDDLEDKAKASGTNHP
uniref:Cytochrome c oxidase assembly factor 3 n=1 Tax=Vombatus ursinus TaxID=29139 RepID=A0A4X2JLV1_VOMUR